MSTVDIKYQIFIEGNEFRISAGDKKPHDKNSAFNILTLIEKALKENLTYSRISIKLLIEYGVELETVSKQGNNGKKPIELTFISYSRWLLELPCNKDSLAQILHCIYIKFFN